MASFLLTIPYAPQDGVMAPSALPLLPGGPLIVGRDGRTYTHRNPLKTLQAMEASFRDYPMVLDENHSLVRAAPEGEPSPGLARLSGFALRADGSIWATQVDWTPNGLDRIAQRAYVGVSPTVLFDKGQAAEQDGVSIEGEILSIENAGLVNEPNFVMPALHSKESEQNMTEEQIKKFVADAIAAALAPVAALKEEFTATVADLSTQLKASVESNAQAAAASHAKRVESTLDRAVAAKKIAPASRAYHAKRLASETDVSEFEATYLKGVTEEVVSNERPARGTHGKNKITDAQFRKDAERLSRDMGVDLKDIDLTDTSDEIEE